VEQLRALVADVLFAVVKQRVHDFLVVQRKANPKKLPITAPSYHKISVLCGITCGDGSLGLELKSALLNMW
jgi:hypothetical protein